MLYLSSQCHVGSAHRTHTVPVTPQAADEAVTKTLQLLAPFPLCSITLTAPPPVSKLTRQFSPIEHQISAKLAQNGEEFFGGVVECIPTKSASQISGDGESKMSIGTYLCFHT